MEVERKSSSARSKVTLLSKRRSPTVGKANNRLLIIQLIQEHNRLDVYKILFQACQAICSRSAKLSLSISIPSEKDLVSIVATVVYGSSRLDLFEMQELCNLLRRMYGDKFVTWAKNNSGRNVDKRVVKKLTQPVEETLVQQYLEAITMPQTPNKASARVEQRPASIGRIAPNGVVSTKRTIPSGDRAPKTTDIRPIQPTPNELSSVSCDVTISRMSPTLPIRIFRPNPRLEIAFDVRTKNPIYVMEKLDGHVKLKHKTTRPSFYEEERLPPEYRSRLCSFVQSGYDRGHMAPAADFGADSIRDTFNLCNISPQEQSMNRSTWAKLEYWCRQVAEQELQQARTPSSNNTSVHIVTGPVWLPTAKTNPAEGGSHVFEFAAIGQGDALVHVPTHFFKVIAVAVGKKRIQKFACFLVPNRKPRQGSGTLDQFLVHWDRLEAITGLQFFPNLVTPNWKEATKRATNLMMTTSPSRPKKVPNDPVASMAVQLEHLRI